MEQMEKGQGQPITEKKKTSPHTTHKRQAWSIQFPPAKNKQTIHTHRHRHDVASYVRMHGDGDDALAENCRNVTKSNNEKEESEKRTKKKNAKRVLCIRCSERVLRMEMVCRYVIHAAYGLYYMPWTLTIHSCICSS